MENVLQPPGLIHFLWRFCFSFETGSILTGHLTVDPLQNRLDVKKSKHEVIKVAHLVKNGTKCTQST